MRPRIGLTTYDETFPGSDITTDEWEFIKAVAAYQKKWNRRYPTWREVLAVAMSLGYRKVSRPDPPDGLRAEIRRPEADPRPADEPQPTPGA